MSIGSGSEAATPMGDLSPTITEVNVQPVSEERLKAFVTIVFNDNFVVHGIKIIRAAGKTFVAMPTRRNPSGKQTDVCHPINSRYRSYIEGTILRAYQRRLEDHGHGSDADADTVTDDAH